MINKECPLCGRWDCECEDILSPEDFRKLTKEEQGKDTCWSCSQRIDEECGIDGREVYPDTPACGSFEK